MIIINLILFSISILIILCLLKKTNSNIFNPGPLWKLILLESFLIIFAPIILILYPEARNVYQMKGTSYDGVVNNSIIFYIQFILLFIGFNFGLKKRNFTSDNYEPTLPIKKSAIYSLTFTLLVLLLITINHVSSIPIFSFLTKENIAINRAIVGSELTGIYSVIHTITLTLSFLIIYVAANLKKQNKHYLLFLLIGIFGLSWFGHKSSIILALLSFYFYIIHDKKINILSIMKIISFLFLLLSTLFIIYYFTIENKADIISEFLNRLFVGQLHGFYQEFEYFKSEIPYWKSWIPLSSFIFGENISYAKDLMDYTEGITATNQIKNTFIGAETHRVLGLGLSIFIMPFIGFFISKISFFTINILTQYIDQSFKTPLLWTLFSSLTITNGMYIYSSFRFIYIFIFSLIPVIAVKLIIDRLKFKKNE